MCLTSHWSIFFSVSQFVVTDNITRRDQRKKYHTARSKEKLTRRDQRKNITRRDIKGKISKLPINIIYFPSSQYLKHMLCIYEYIYWHRIVNICNIVFNFVIVRKIYIKCRVEKYSFIMLWITVFFGFAR